MAGSTTHRDPCGDDSWSRAKAPTALYQPAVADAAYQLRYAWTDWPSRGYSLARHSLWELIEQTKPHWERDSWRVWEDRGTDDGVQILFSTTPEITPIVVAQRAKGRLADALRSAGLRVPFSRKVAVRAVGDNTRRDVEAYLERQVAGYVVARLSVMLSHLHAALRAEPDTVPLEIAFCYQNKLAHLPRL